MNKLDTATPELVAEFQKWANGLFPPKLLIAGTTHGRLDPAWLDLTANDERLPLYPGGAWHTTTRHAPSGEGAEPPTLRQLRGLPTSPLLASRSATPRRPAFAPACCGWIFDAADVFDEGKLLALLGGVKGVTRLKGVFHLAG